MATYATIADFEAYTIGWTQTTDAAALEKYLQHAERDVDNLMGSQALVDPSTGVQLAPVWRNATTCLRLDPATLPAWMRKRLANAVCAQAKLRIDLPDLFSRDQYQSVSGRGGVTGKLARVSPEVYGELNGTGLLAAWGTTA